MEALKGHRQNVPGAKLGNEASLLNAGLTTTERGGIEIGRNEIASHLTSHTLLCSLPQGFPAFLKNTSTVIFYLLSFSLSFEVLLKCCLP